MTAPGTIPIKDISTPDPKVRSRRLVDNAFTDVKAAKRELAAGNPGQARLLLQVAKAAISAALLSLGGCAEVERAGITQIGPIGFTMKIPDWYAQPSPQIECGCAHWVQADGGYQCIESTCPIHGGKS